MFGSKILDVAIGLIFVYIIVSVLCTAVREGIEAFLKTRAAYLEHGIRLLLQDDTGAGIVNEVFSHPLIDGLFIGHYKPRSKTTGAHRPLTGGNLPSYIPTKSFASALLDIAARGPAGASLDRYRTPMSLDAIRCNVVANIPNNSKIQRVVLHAVDAAQGDLDKAQKAVEEMVRQCDGSRLRVVQTDDALRRAGPRTADRRRNECRLRRDHRQALQNRCGSRGGRRGGDERGRQVQ